MSERSKKYTQAPIKRAAYALKVAIIVRELLQDAAALCAVGLCDVPVLLVIDVVRKLGDVSSRDPVVVLQGALHNVERDAGAFAAALHVANGLPVRLLRWALDAPAGREAHAVDELVQHSGDEVGTTTRRLGIRTKVPRLDRVEIGYNFVGRIFVVGGVIIGICSGVVKLDPERSRDQVLTASPRMVGRRTGSAEVTLFPLAPRKTNANLHLDNERIRDDVALCELFQVRSIQNAPKTSDQALRTARASARRTFDFAFPL